MVVINIVPAFTTISQLPAPNSWSSRKLNSNTEQKTFGLWPSQGPGSFGCQKNNVRNRAQCHMPPATHTLQPTLNYNVAHCTLKLATCKIKLAVGSWKPILHPPSSILHPPSCIFHVPLPRPYNMRSAIWPLASCIWYLVPGSWLLAPCP